MTPISDEKTEVEPLESAGVIPAIDNAAASSRRVFLSKTGKLIALAAFGHFTLLGGNAFAADDACPGGLPAADTCNAPDNSDKCPGEAAPADECPSTGERSADECNTGKADADICNETADPASDQCESGNTSDDKCVSEGEGDHCPTGQAPEDACPDDGGLDDGDVCLGGGSTTNGQEQDTCDGGGDECTPGSGDGPGGPEGDACRESPETPADECTLTDDDVCYNGTNGGGMMMGGGDGGNDACDSLGSDQCNDGSPEQDSCTQEGMDSSGQYDTCPGGGTSVDTCEAGVSPDYCGADPDSDECGAPADADQCPGGTAPADSCPGGSAPEDECPAGVACADV